MSRQHSKRFSKTKRRLARKEKKQRESELRNLDEDTKQFVRLLLIIICIPILIISGAVLWASGMMLGFALLGVGILWLLFVLFPNSSTESIEWNERREPSHYEPD